jgi:Zn ribbon nucleic-acid-binding protein
MGSVIDYIECPNCKTEAYSDFYYKTGEEYVNCSNCGYHRSATIINRDKKLSELTEADWNIEELKNPYGAYKIKVYHSPIRQCGSLENEEQYNNFKIANEVDVEIEYCSISKLVDGKIITEIIIDNGPYTDSAGYTAEDRQNESDLNALENSSPEY